MCSRSGCSGWSAGRAGRVAAARAALHARLAGALLLDEPAAALDASAERALLAALAAVAPHTTIITVAVSPYSSLQPKTVIGGYPGF